MTSSLYSFADGLLSWLLTWWLHSSLLIGLAWVGVRLVKPRSHFVREQLWKIAATAGFVTATVQLTLGTGFTVGGESTKPQFVKTSRQPLAASGKPDADSQAALNDVRHTFTEILSELNDAADVINSRPAVGFEQQDLDLVSDNAIVDELAFPEQPSVPHNTNQGAISDEVVGVDPERTQSGRADSNLGMRRRHASYVGSYRNVVAASLAVAWITGGLLWILVQAWHFQRQLRGSRAAAASHVEMLRRITRQAGIRREIRLLRSDRFNEPVAFGLVTWTILLPVDAERKLSRDELRALLSHELAHLVRGDVIWLWLGRVLTTCFAFQPLHFLARRRWQLCAEFQCDDWALKQQVSELTLARSLTAVAEWRALPSPCGDALAAAGPKFHVTDRVERLLAGVTPDPWRLLSRRLLVQGLAMSILAGVILLGPSAASHSPDELEAADSVSQHSPPASDLSAGSMVDIEDLTAIREEMQLLRGNVDEMVQELSDLQPHLDSLSTDAGTRIIVERIRHRLSLLQDDPRDAQEASTMSLPGLIRSEATRQQLDETAQSASAVRQ